MKSSTYASLVTIVFLQYREAVSKSIENVIRTTDQLCERLGLPSTLSHMTKYRIVSDLVQSNILAVRKTKKNTKVMLSQKIINIL